LVDLNCTYSNPGISGFFFHTQPSYQPPTDLTDFLKAGPPPIYIGFGSIVIDNPTNLTQTLFKVISTLNVRALISKGWGGLSSQSTPENIFFIDNVPHDWLFPRVQIVVHHGGAGTTAIGLKCGKPTVVVSFFGDQKFWGEMCARAGAGPNPIPFKELSVDKLIEGIKFALGDGAKRAAEELSLRISKEDGVGNAIDGFHRLLPLKRMRCCIFPEKVAIWSVPELNLGISSQVAGVLDKERILDLKKLKLSQHKVYDTENQQVTPLKQRLRIVGSNHRFTSSCNWIWC
jgi:sterol 3beta-glucosyltransferase